jgi:hypothetical protein
LFARQLQPRFEKYERWRTGFIPCEIISESAD